MNIVTRNKRISVLLLCGYETAERIRNMFARQERYFLVSEPFGDLDVGESIAALRPDCIIVDTVYRNASNDLLRANASVVYLTDDMMSPTAGDEMESGSCSFPKSLLSSENGGDFLISAVLRALRERRIQSKSAGALRAAMDRTARYYRIMDLLPLIIVRFSADDRLISYVNDGFCAFFRRKKASVIGEPVDEVLPRDVYAAIAMRLGEAGMQKTPAIFEECFKRGGRTCWIQWMAEPLVAGSGSVIAFQCIGNDVSEKKLALESETVYDELDRLAVTLRSIGDGIITTDEQKRVVLFNKIAEEITGYLHDEAVGRPVNEVFNVTFKEAADEFRGPSGFEPVLIARNGTEKHIAFSITTIPDKSGNNAGDCIAFRDITEKRSMEKEIYRQKLYLQSILDSEENMTIVTDAREIFNANHSFVSFFGFQTLAELKSAYPMIANMPVVYEYSTVKEGENWIEAFLRNHSGPAVVAFRFSMTSGLRFFAVRISRLSVDVDRFVVTLTDITELQERSKDFEEKASIDTLTKIYNRRKFNEIIEYQIEISKRYNHKLALIFFDIDHFKNINDTYGHQVGDYILQDLSDAVKRNIRKADIFARWGGEEFILLLPQTGKQESLYIAEKIRSRIESLRFDPVGVVTCSFGISELKKDDTVEPFIARADEALYRAKRSGRNRIEVEI